MIQQSSSTELDIFVDRNATGEVISAYKLLTMMGSSLSYTKAMGVFGGEGMGDCKQNSNIYIKIFSFGKTEARLSMLHNHRENSLNVQVQAG